MRNWPAFARVICLVLTVSTFLSCAGRRRGGKTPAIAVQPATGDTHEGGRQPYENERAYGEVSPALRDVPHERTHTSSVWPEVLVKVCHCSHLGLVAETARADHSCLLPSAMHRRVSVALLGECLEDSAQTLLMHGRVTHVRSQGSHVVFSLCFPQGNEGFKPLAEALGHNRVASWVLTLDGLNRNGSVDVQLVPSLEKVRAQLRGEMVCSDCDFILLASRFAASSVSCPRAWARILCLLA